MANPETCRYAKSHEWISLEGATGTVGISDHAQHEITDVVFVDLPKVGRKVAAGEACAVVESVKAAFDIYAPAAGEIAEVNQSLVGDPSLVNQSPHDKGWFFKLKGVDAAKLGSLMDHKTYQDFLKTAAK